MKTKNAENLKVKIKKLVNQPVYLTWDDVRSHSSWIARPLDLDPIECTTYGLVVGINDSENCIVMASTKATEEDLPPYSEVNVIPLSLVRRLEKI